MSSLYPVFLDLNGKPCLVVGAGEVAARKIPPLLECSAEVTVVAPAAVEEIRTLAAQGLVVLRQRPFEPGDAEGSALVIAATGDEEANRSVSAACRSRKIPCNVVDVPGLCDFHVPAVARRGEITVAVSTGGRCPAFAGFLRGEIEKALSGRHGAALEVLARLRAGLLAREDLEQPERALILRRAVSSPALADFLAGRTDTLELEVPQ